ncbi:MAG: ExeA family protein [Candidatus Lindowbacteria bacterium]|nr:ExeA family protein [Candidatus Lindowbacteria bacterium]
MEAVAKPLDMTFDYCEHFGLQRMPFNDSVNPEFFYRTAGHEAALVRMMVCAKQHKALGLIWGRSGTGKTLLAQMLLTALEGNEFIPAVILANPGMSKTSLLACIMEELGIPRTVVRENAQACLENIHSFLMESYSRGQRVVIIIDEAHFLPSDQLHMIRTLTNLETPQEKLCTVIMMAEETFPRRLRHKRYSSLRGRIALSSYLMPMSRAETEQYMKFRLMIAGSNDDLFSADCYDLIHAHTGGICREISKIADNALMEAYLRGESKVSRGIVEHCVSNGL